MKYKLEIKWAILFIGATLLWMLLEKATGLHSTHIDKQMYLTNLFAIPAILIYVFAFKEKKTAHAGVLTYKAAVGSGLIITLLVAILSPPTQWVISEIITPEYFPNVIAYSVESGYYQTIEEAQAYFNLENYMIQSAVAALIMGIITSVVVAFFVKSKSQ